MREGQGAGSRVAAALAVAAVVVACGPSEEEALAAVEEAGAEICDRVERDGPEKFLTRLHQDRSLDIGPSDAVDRTISTVNLRSKVIELVKSIAGEDELQITIKSGLSNLNGPRAVERECPDLWRQLESLAECYHGNRSGEGCSVE